MDFRRTGGERECGEEISELYRVLTWLKPAKSQEFRICCCVLLGHDWEEEEKQCADKWTPGGSKRKEKDRPGARLGGVGPRGNWVEREDRGRGERWARGWEDGVGLRPE